jgi:hypothetical protein
MIFALDVYLEIFLKYLGSNVEEKVSERGPIDEVVLILEENGSATFFEYVSLVFFSSKTF